jgi:hypothetical protein
MRRNESAADADERSELVQLRYAEAVARERFAFDVLELARDGNKDVRMDDVQAGRRYLLTCLQRMELVELQTVTPRVLSTLWARGAAGAAQWRLGQRERPASRRRRG